MKNFKNNNIFEVANKILNGFDQICPTGCNLCEFNESVVLLPGEEDYCGINNQTLKKFNVRSEFYFMSSCGDHCPLFKNTFCDVYSKRPIDCKMFPLFPIFNIKDNTVELGYADGYCPIVNDIQDDFIQAVYEVCKLINLKTDVEWKLLYNEMNSKQEVITCTIPFPEIDNFELSLI